MKKLFIYYSFTGNGEVVAKEMEKKGYELRKVIRKKKMPKSFFWGMMVGGFLAGTKHKDKLVNFNPDVKEYDEVVIAGPIWNGRFSSPINTVIKELKDEKDKINFLFYSGSGEGKGALKRIQKEFPNAKYIFLKEPKKYPEELQKLKQLQ